MALINYSGNYHKIESIDLINNTCLISKWENEEHRQTGDTDFRKHEVIQTPLVNLYESLQEQPLEDRNILNNIKTIGYIELKKISPYNEMGDDVIPTEPEPEEPEEE